MSDEGRDLAHATEEELILHYYGEAAAATVLEAHLQACADCRAEWQAIRDSLDAVTEALDAPGRDEPSPARIDSMWPALAPRLRRRRAWTRAWVPLAAAAALVLAFLLGRHWPGPPPVAPAAQAQASERILLVAVGEHLERSQMLLVELSNAPRSQAMDMAREQEWAQELVGANRLYRHTAARAGEAGLASVLEELERVLVEVAHSPTRLEPSQVAQLQRRIESRGLLFKVRVLEWRVREKQKVEAPPGALS